jgi:hypothetical protein
MTIRAYSAAIAFAGALLTATAAHAAADLVPIPSRIAHGVVSVKNAGATTAGPSIVTVECNQSGGVGGCAETPAMARFSDPAYPNKLVVKVLKLAAGKVFNFNLPFWAGLVWAPNSYTFSFTADAGAAVAESNEANNAGAHVMTLP